MKYKLILSLSFLFSTQAISAAKISYLKLENDIVFFSTNELKQHIVPSCVATETNQNYTVSLKNEIGRAIYSLLITALSNKQAISIESALDCADTAGVERAKVVEVIPVYEPIKELKKSLKLVGFGTYRAEYFSGEGYRRSCTMLLTLKDKQGNPYFYTDYSDNSLCKCRNSLRAKRDLPKVSGVYQSFVQCFIED